MLEAIYPWLMVFGLLILPTIGGIYWLIFIAPGLERDLAKTVRQKTKSLVTYPVRQEMMTERLISRNLTDSYENRWRKG